MVKQTKRQRKFNSSGGVKARLEKGTVTKHGKIRKNRGKAVSGEPKATKLVAVDEPFKKIDRQDDFLGVDNIGNLDLDSFFNKLSDRVETSIDSGSELISDDKTTDDVNHSTEKTMISSENSNSSSDGGNIGSDDDSDDEDVNAAEAKMKSQLALMQQSDPDFHKFLRENEESLLEFGEDEEGDDNEQSLERKVEIDEKLEKSELNAFHLTLSVVADLSRTSFEEHSIKSLKSILSAYKYACHLADSSGDKEETARENEKKYRIDSPKVFDDLMVICLSKCHGEFRHHLLGIKDEKDEDDEDDKNVGNKESEFSKPINPSILEKSARWPQMKTLVTSFFQSTIHLLSEAKDSELLSFVLKSLSKSLCFLPPFPRIADALLKVLISMWSAPLDSSEDYQVVRLNAFFRIRQLALTQPFPFIEDILKKMYLAYAKRAKFGTSSSGLSSSLPTLTFMGNCLVEVYGLDYPSSYQHAFVYIRQLALLLRTALQKKTADAMKNVFCWQYFNCLKLWVAVLSSAAGADDGAIMRSLIYPVTEIIFGTARFAPSPVRNLPCRFLCVRLLQQLVASSETFIPTTSLLLDCFDWKEWYLSPKKSTSSSGRATRGLQLQYMLKLPGMTDFLRLHEHLEAGINDLFLLLRREVELYRFSAGFPEFSIRIQVRLRQFAKVTKNARWRTFAKGLLEDIEKCSKEAVWKRSTLAEAPKDVKRLECILPIGMKTMRERHEASVANEQKALEKNKPASSPKKTRQLGSDDDSDGEDDGSADDKEPRKKKQKTADNTNAKKTVSKIELKQQMLGEEELREKVDQVNDGVDWSDEDSE